MNLCNYGCNNEAKYVLRNGKNCCSDSPNKCSENRRKNSEGIKQAHLEGRMRESFTDEDRKKSISVRQEKTVKQIFIKNSTYNNSNIKEYLLLYFKWEYKCNKCGISNWFGEEICLEVDHIDGNKFNNELTNLRFLCPNCHSQTHGWRGRNINNGKVKVSEEELLKALQEESNIRKALIKVGLTPKGGNYEKAYKIIQKNNLIDKFRNKKWDCGVKLVAATGLSPVVNS